MDSAGAAFGVKCEGGVSAPEIDTAGAGLNLPRTGGSSANRDMTGSCFSVDAALNILQFDGAGAGLRLGIAFAGKLGVDASRTRFKRNATTEAGGAESPVRNWKNSGWSGWRSLPT